MDGGARRWAAARLVVKRGVADDGWREASSPAVEGEGVIGGGGGGPLPVISSSRARTSSSPLTGLAMVLACGC